MKRSFPTDLSSIRKKIEAIDPVRYAQTRNFLSGAVTELSPYISRGVISVKDVFNHLIQTGVDFDSCETLVRELAWREYFQRVWQNRDVNADLRQPQVDVRHQGIPEVILNGKTGIAGVDSAIKELYQTGYMHNHARMYTASISCNIARCGWMQPAKWMYYHLLDGDWASNACSWQWVAGANSSKKYYANQENISRYTGKNQTGTFLDTGYDLLPFIPCPEHLNEVAVFQGQTSLPQSDLSGIKSELPVLIYNYYNLDPEWMKDVQANRIFFFEKNVFEKYPVSQTCIDFALKLASNIPEIRIFSGTWEELFQKVQGLEIHFKEHPLNRHYSGTVHERDWICPELTGYYPSFSGYWKKAEPRIRRQFAEVNIKQTEINFSEVD